MKKNNKTKKSNSKKKTTKVIKKSYSINLYLFIALITILFFSLLLFGLRAYAHSKIIDIKEINYTLNVSDYVGVNLDSDKLHFGGVIPDGYSTRSLSIISEKEGFVFVKTDDLDWISVNYQGQKIVPGQQVFFVFQARVPKTAEKQNVEGKIYFYFMKTNKDWPLFFFKGKKANIFVEEKQPSIKLDISKK